MMNGKLKFVLIPAGVLLVLLVLLWAVGGFAEENRLFALDAENGRIAWSRVFPNAQNIGDPVLVENSVLLEVVTRADEDAYHHTVAALNAANGERQWTYQSAPHIRNDSGTPKLYLQSLPGTPYVVIGSEQPNTADYHIQIIDSNSGAALWSSNSTFLGGNIWFEWGRTIPVINDSLFLISREDIQNVALQARELRSGAVQWQVPLGMDGFDLWQRT
ncbi:MAG: PQQ-binding-like beta-propeller repeat protein, partial [Anaerolineales bacterium]|nr:PQQ-binding-like beta-propeller repeat protein [Anaerolineales bacterium]